MTDVNTKTGLSKERRAELRARCGGMWMDTSFTYAKVAEMLALLDALDRAEAEHDERLFALAEEITALRADVARAEATIARLTAPVTEDEWRGFVMKAMWFREAGNVETPTWEALTAFLEGRKGSTLSPPERTKE